jgi:hypothetical protein
MRREHVARQPGLKKMATSSSSSQDLVNKPHSTSVVWTHFGLKTDDKGVPIPEETDQPVCRHCNKVVPSKRSTTTNMFTYLEEHHPQIYTEIGRGKTVSKKTPTLPEMFEKTKMYDPKSHRA